MPGVRFWWCSCVVMRLFAVHTAVCVCVCQLLAVSALFLAFQFELCYLATFQKQIMRLRTESGTINRNKNNVSAFTDMPDKYNSWQSNSHIKSQMKIIPDSHWCLQNVTGGILESVPVFALSLASLAATVPVCSVMSHISKTISLQRYFPLNLIEVHKIYLGGQN